MIKLSNFSSFFVANWKLNGNFQFIDQFINNISLPKDNSKCVVICPTSIHLDYMSKNKKGFYVGAQNVSEYDEGAFTGEISAQSLSDLNVSFCIVGHSERRSLYKETDNAINDKIKLLVEANITPILCIGETWEQRQDAIGEEIVSNQLSSCLDGLEACEIIIAYEPIWAIGSGNSCNTEQIIEVSSEVKSLCGESTPFIYGGSVNEDNCKELLSQNEIDGLLVGSASLSLDSFNKMISSINSD